MAMPTRILYCNCTYAQVVPKEVKEAVLRKLCESGVAFEAVADLCEMSARQDPGLKRLTEGGALKIAACYPRAVKWLFSAAQAPLAPEQTEILNMRAQSAPGENPKIQKPPEVVVPEILRMLDPAFAKTGVLYDFPTDRTERLLRR